MPSFATPISHKLLFDSSITLRVAEYLELSGDRCSLARVARGIYLPAIHALYRCIRIPGSEGVDKRVGASVRRQALLETLEGNADLGRAVLRIQCAMTPARDLKRIIEACPGIRSMKLSLVSLNSIPLWTQTLLPNLPSTIRHMEIFYDSLTRLSAETVTRAFANITEIQTLSIYSNTTLENARIILENCSGINIIRLKISSWGSWYHKLRIVEYNALFAYVPHITSLCLFTITYDQIETFQFPPLLRTLSIEVASFKPVECIIARMALDMTWCPHLTNLVHFKTINHVEVLRSTQIGRHRLEAFQETCKRAHLTRSRGIDWRGKVIEWERLASIALEPSSRNDSHRPLWSLGDRRERPPSGVRFDRPGQLLARRPTRRRLNRALQAETEDARRDARQGRRVTPRFRLGRRRRHQRTPSPLRDYLNGRDHD